MFGLAPETCPAWLCKHAQSWRSTVSTDHAPMPARRTTAYVLPVIAVGLSISRSRVRSLPGSPLKATPRLLHPATNVLNAGL